MPSTWEVRRQARDAEKLGQLHLRPYVINTRPSVRTVLVDSGVPFTSATWVITEHVEP